MRYRRRGTLLCLRVADVRGPSDRVKVARVSGGDIFLIVGLALATLGALLLAYDAVYGAGARFRANNAAQQLAILRQTRTETKAILAGLGGSWTEEEKQKQLDDEEQRWGPVERELQQKAGSILEQHENRVITLATTGIGLLVGAFALQLAGTVMVALDHS